MKTKIILIIFLIFLILGIVMYILSSPKNTLPPPFPFPTPTPIIVSPAAQDNTKNGYKNIFPGKSSKNDVLKTLGQPVKSETKDGIEILYYPTTSKFLFTEIVISNNVKYITQNNVEEDVFYSDLLEKLKDSPKGTVYDPNDSVYKWMVFSNYGLAVFTNDGGFILKFLYFQPMTFNEFTNSIAKDLSLSVTPPQPGF